MMNACLIYFRSFYCVVFKLSGPVFWQCEKNFLLWSICGFCYFRSLNSFACLYWHDASPAMASNPNEIVRLQISQHVSNIINWYNDRFSRLDWMNKFKYHWSKKCSLFLSSILACYKLPLKNPTLSSPCHRLAMIVPVKTEMRHAKAAKENIV